MISNITEIHEMINSLLEEAFYGKNEIRQCLLFYLSDNEDKIQKILLDLSDSPLNTKDPRSLISFIKKTEANWKKQDLKLVELGFISQIQATDMRSMSKEDAAIIQKQREAIGDLGKISKFSPEGKIISEIVEKYGTTQDVLFYVESINESRPIVYKGLIIDKTQIGPEGSMDKIGLELDTLEILPDKVEGVTKRGESLNNFLFNIFSK